MTTQGVFRKPKLLLLNIVCKDESLNPYQKDHTLDKINLFITIMLLKERIRNKFKIHHTNFRLFYQQLELTKNNDQICSYGIKSNSTIIVYPFPDLECINIGLIKEYELFNEGTPQELKNILGSIKKALSFKIKPILAEFGTSGSYFLENINRNKIAIFKPLDEEPYAPNNPRGMKGDLGQQGFRPGILSGENASREVFAYLLDHLYGHWHGVPPTTFIEFYHPSFAENDDNQLRQLYPPKLEYSNRQFIRRIKHGSLQMFVDHDDYAENYSEQMLDDNYIHRIAILDIRILNCDRNLENILIKKVEKNKPFKLIPIDHGFSLPDPIEIYDYEVSWSDWKSAKKPFTQEELQFIKSIDIKRDCEYLSKKLKIRPKCLRNFRIANTLLKKAAYSGLNLYEIGKIIYRQDEEEKSLLEKIIKKAEEFVKYKNFIIKQQNHIQLEDIQLSRNVSSTVRNVSSTDEEEKFQIIDKIISFNLKKNNSCSTKQEQEQNQNDIQFKLCRQETSIIIGKKKSNKIRRVMSQPEFQLYEIVQNNNLQNLKNNHKDIEQKIQNGNKTNLYDHDEGRWDNENFFDFLDFILDEYLKKVDKQNIRSRYMSTDIQDEDFL